MAIIIEKNPNGDTRTAPNGITFEQLQKANDMHREDVRKVMTEEELEIILSHLMDEQEKRG